MSAFIVVAVLVIALALWLLPGGGLLPAPFAGRSCQGRAWRHAFPAATKDEIREFLSLIVNAFAFRDPERLKLNPADQVMAVYRSLYPKRWMPDALEVETLARDFYKRYGVDLDAVWSDDVTLGDLFAHAQGAPA